MQRIRKWLDKSTRCCSSDNCLLACSLNISLMQLSPSLSLAEVAAYLGCSYRGAPDFQITGINEIHRVQAGDLTFVDVEKYYKKALNCAASVILIPGEVEIPVGKALIISEDPFRDFNQLTEWLRPSHSLDIAGIPSLGEGVRIAERVSFGEGVIVGDLTQIAAGVVIGSGVHIGRNCRIHPNVTIYDHCIIGDEVTINAGTVIGGEAFYFKTRPDRRDKMLSKGRVVIHDHVDIGSNCTIDRGVTADTVIGAWTKLDNLIQIGHDTVIGQRCLIASQVGIAGVVTVEDEVILWGQVGVVKDLTIGKGAILMGKTGVMSSLEGGKTYLGMIAAELRSSLREVAALKKLPELIKWWEKREAD